MGRIGASSAIYNIHKLDNMSPFAAFELGGYQEISVLPHVCITLFQGGAIRIISA